MNGKTDAKNGLDFTVADGEALPVETASLDAVISNGVINLSPDKKQVFAEASRVLRPGGRLALADIVTEVQLTDAIVCNADLWASCIGGAALESAYFEALGASKKYGVKSISLLARKP